MTPEWGTDARALPPETQVGLRCREGWGRAQHSCCASFPRPFSHTWKQPAAHFNNRQRVAGHYTAQHVLRQALRRSVQPTLPPWTAVQFMLLDLGEDRYAVLLPLIDKQTYRATLRPPRQVRRPLLLVCGGLLPQAVL